METIFDMCTECCRSPLPAFGRRYKRTVLIFLLYSLLLIDISASLIRCYRDSDCGTNQCCTGYYHMNTAHTRCKPKLMKDTSCFGFAHKRKYIRLPNGQGVFDRCGCSSELTCTKIKRKHWKRKQKFWFQKKKKIKSQYKFRCKYLPPEPEERVEWR